MKWIIFRDYSNFSIYTEFMSLQAGMGIKSRTRGLQNASGITEFY